jgi:hypothetical protein
MGILVQRQFTVEADDRAEFERQSRLGVWENMRYNGAQMVAYGNWAFGDTGEVVVTNSAYADFDHWTATRPWGVFATEPARVEETKAIRAISAGRQRLVRHSRASITVLDDEQSSPEVAWRHVGEPLAPVPVSFGRQSVVEEIRCGLRGDDAASFDAISRDVLWPHAAEHGGRVLVAGHDPLLPPPNRVVMVAYPDISSWYVANEAGGEPAAAMARRAALATSTTTKLLMVATDYGTF